MDTAHFKQLDWDFKKESSRRFLHNLCWYPSRFIPMIPAQLIANLSHPGDLVFDPFCGSGTVSIEALRQGRNSICLDINPVGCYVAGIKAKLYSGEYIDLKELDNLLNEIEITYKEKHKKSLFPFEPKLKNRNFQIPNQSDLTTWYHEKTLEELAALFSYIESVDHELTKDVIKLIFISIIMPSAGHQGGRPYTYYADNVRPKVLIYKNAFKLFKQKLKRFLSEYHFRSPIKKPDVSWEIINGDARYLPKRLTRSVDLIVTSPPYLNVTDYNTAFRLVHLWYKWNDPIDVLKQSEIGARWKRKHRNEPTDYKKDMEICYSEMAKCLKKDKYLCIIIGESKKNQNRVICHVTKFLTEHLNLDLIYSTSRTISQKFFIHPSGGVKTENIFIFRK